MDMNILGASAKCSAMSWKADGKPWYYLFPASLKEQAQQSPVDWYTGSQKADGWWQNDIARQLG